MSIIVHGAATALAPAALMFAIAGLWHQAFLCLGLGALLCLLILAWPKGPRS